MASNILHKRNAAGAVPTTGQLALGEIAIDTLNGKLYIKKTDGGESIVEIGSGGGGSQTPWTSTIDAAGFNLTTASAVDIQILQGGHVGDNRTAGLGLYAEDPIQIESNGAVNVKGGGQYGAKIDISLTTIDLDADIVHVTGNGSGKVLLTDGGANEGTTIEQGSDNFTAVLFRLPPNNGNAGDVLTNAAGDGVTTWEPESSKTANAIATTGPITLDIAIGTYFYNTATTGIITFTFTNPPSSRVYTMVLELFGGGTNAPVWPASVTWPSGTEPTWTTGIDVVTFITRDAGTTWLGMLGGTAFA